MKLFESQIIDAWHEKLNSKLAVPQGCYRRNLRIYELVCYVNNIIALFLSHNEEPILVFIRRARKYMNENKKNNETQEYYKMVTEYLDEVETHLKTHGVDTSSIYKLIKTVK